MPLIEIPDHIRQTVLIDFALKNICLKNTENENVNPQNETGTTLPLTTVPNTTTPYVLAEPNKNINPSHLKSKRAEYYLDTPYLIYSIKGNNYFLKYNNTVENFIAENHICTFKDFLSTVKEGSLEKLLRLNFVKNHFNASDIDGDNALNLATFFNFTDIMHYLLANKSPVNLRNKTGHNAIDIAAALGYRTAVEILIYHDGCEEIEEHDCTALYHAVQNGHTQIADMLRTKIKMNFVEYENHRKYRVPIRL